jgi:transaldolase
MTLIQQNPLFFFDTANLDVIERTWEKLSKTVSPRSVSGITTNPNALSKVNCTNLRELETLVYRLSRFLTQIRGDTTGAVHVQLPSSQASDETCVKWANYLHGLGDGRSHVAMKIPPFKSILECVQNRQLNNLVQINVTGVSDAATALRCFSYPAVSYVSIIPGRMEEVGIDAQSHLQFTNHRRGAFVQNQYVIAGSMRTVDGLQRSIDAGCVPTIGQRVWEAMTDDDYANFATMWRGIEIDMGDYGHSIPLIDDRNVNLSVSFFDEMDKLAEPLYTEFSER